MGCTESGRCADGARDPCCHREAGPRSCGPRHRRFTMTSSGFESGRWKFKILGIPQASYNFSAAAASCMATRERIRFKKMRQNQPAPYLH